jgi:hypothetical protein
MLWQIALAVVLLWFLSGIVGAILKSIGTRIRIFTGLCAVGAVLLACYMWLG